jgi:hypothetical protein
MVKTPKTRHSKTHREPVVIDLDPDQVARAVEDPVPAPDADPATTPEPQPDASADFEAWEQANPSAASEPGMNWPPAEAEGPGNAEARDQVEPVKEKPSANAENEQPRQEKMTASPNEPKSSRATGMSGLAAGIVGGIVALAGDGALQFAGILGAPGAGGSLDGVNNDIAAMKSEIAAITKSETGGEAAARVKGLSDALDQVRADVAALKSATASGSGADAELAALSDKVQSIEATVSALDKPAEATPADLGPLTEKLAALDALVKSAGDATAEQQSRLGALEQSLSQLSAKVEAQAAQPKIALSIAASALKAALDRGAPFAAELETFAAIAPDAPQIAALRIHAANGVATRAAIAAEADAAATAMAAADVPVDENAGLLQNLLSSAGSLVKVRPIGAVEGKGVPETVARLEADVQRGDYAKALAEYETLPAAAKAAGAAFAEKLKARLEAETQVDALVADAMKA